MLNQCNFVGRLTDLPSGGQTQGGTSYARFDIAVQRNFKNHDGDYDADFIRCACFGKTADYLMKYAGKGDTVSASGQLQNNNYTDNNGQKHYSMQLSAREVQIISHPAKKDESRRHYQRQQRQAQSQQAQPQSQSLPPMPDESQEPPAPTGKPVDVADDDLPFD